MKIVGRDVMKKIGYCSVILGMCMSISMYGFKVTIKNETGMVFHCGIKFVDEAIAKAVFKEVYVDSGGAEVLGEEIVKNVDSLYICPYMPGEQVSLKPIVFKGSRDVGNAIKRYTDANCLFVQLDGGQNEEIIIKGEWDDEYEVHIQRVEYDEQKNKKHVTYAVASNDLSVFDGKNKWKNKQNDLSMKRLVERKKKPVFTFW